MIKLKILRWGDCPECSGWALSAIIIVFTREWQREKRYRQKGGQWEDQCRDRKMWPQALGCWQPQKQGEADSALESLEESLTLPALWFWLVIKFRLLAPRVVTEWILLFLSHSFPSNCSQSSLKKTDTGMLCKYITLWFILTPRTEKNNLTSQVSLQTGVLLSFLMDHSIVSVDLNSLVLSVK